MAKALHGHRTDRREASADHAYTGYDTAGIDWRRGMSNNVAYALLTYTGLHIFFTVKAMAAGGGSILPYLALVVLIALIIPACRALERRWVHIPDEQAHDPALKGAYRRDQIVLWAFALGLPALLTTLFTILF